jgi:hypothetical protein
VEPKSNMPKSPGKRLLVMIAIVISLFIVGAAQADISGRKPWELTFERKGFWRLASLNALGALAYFRWGRRRY